MASVKCELACYHWALHLAGHFLLLEFLPLIEGDQLAPPLLIRLHLRRLRNLRGHPRNSGFVVSEQGGGQPVDIWIASNESLLALPYPSRMVWLTPVIQAFRLRRRVRFLLVA